LKCLKEVRKPLKKIKQTFVSDAFKDVNLLETIDTFFAKMTACNTNINYD